MEERKEVFIVGTCGVPASYGGFETLVDKLVEHCGNKVKFTVFCDKNTKILNLNLTEYKGADLKYLPLKANGISSIFYDALSMLKCLVARPDCILVLGVSGAFMIPFLRIMSNSKIVTNVDGLEWKRSKWGALAKIYLWCSEWIAIKFSSVVIADNRGIVDYLQEYRGVDAQCIAYGGDNTADSELKPCNIDFDYSTEYFLSICRIEPENNVEMILEAFSNSNKKLLFIGNWQSSAFSKFLFEKFSGHSRLSLLDPIYDKQIIKLLRERCIAYVHGHSAGGTNPTLVESLWYSPEVLAFDCCFNRYTLDEMGHYFIDSGSLSELLKNNDFKCPEHNYRKLAELRYNWTEISSQYLSIFTQDTACAKK